MIVDQARVRAVTDGPRELCEAVVFLCGWNARDGVPIFVDGKQIPNGRTGTGLHRFAERLERTRNVELEIGLPRQGGMVAESTVLWCWTNSPESLGFAERFRPAPSMVFRFGASAERLLLWALDEPVGWQALELCVDKVAYALRAPRNRGVAEELRVPVPGTFRRRGRSRPVPVLVTRLDGAAYPVGEIVDGLRVPPSKDAWKDRAA